MSLFHTGLSGLGIARTALVTTAHNTANVHTKGYSRQSVVVAANQALGTNSGFIGTGARVTTVQRTYDQYLGSQLSQAESGMAALETYGSQLSRLDNLLADRESGVAGLLQGFFSAVQGVADTPADPAARQQLLSKAEALAGKFRSVDGYLTELNTALNEQIDGAVHQVNAIAEQVASLNKRISQLSASVGGQPPNDLLDTRDQLVNDLGKLVDVTVVRQDGGQYNIFVGNGHTLVLGDRASVMSSEPSNADPTRRAISISGATGSVIQLRDGDVTGGSLGGVMAFRAQALVGVQNALGRMATAMAHAFNAQHRQGFDLLGTPGGDFFSLSGPQTWSNKSNAGDMALAATVLDGGALTASDYSVSVGGAPGALSYTVTRIADRQSVGTFTGLPVTVDGLSIDVASGTAAPGDQFLIQPMRNAARDLAVAVSDPAQIAAAGAVTGVSDGRNALELAALQRKNVIGNGTATLNGAYAGLVSDVGNRTMEVQVALETQTSLASQVRASQQSFSGVNQDEETANLLMFQQMYQANAKVIQTASTIFDTILGLR